MGQTCKICGKALEERDTIAWRFFEMVCGSCFLPCAKYILENMEGLEAVVRADQITPGIYGQA